MGPKSDLETEFKKIHHHYKFIVENSLSAIYIFQEKEFIYVNPACERLTGYSKEEMLNFSYVDLIHPEDRGWMAKATESVLADVSEPQPQPEFRIVRKNGETRWVRLIANLVLYKGKRTIISHIMDIHPQKMMEKKLKESEEKYRVVVENAAEAILVIQKWKVKYFNSTALRMSGYSRDELSTLSLEDFIHPEDLEKLKTRHQMRLKGKEFEEVYPFRFIDKKGNVKWVEIHVVIVTWEGEKATLNFLNDITERKKARDALEKSEQKFRNWVERANDGIAIVQDKKFKYINQKVADMHEYPVEEMLGKNFYDFVSPEERSKLKERYQKRMRGEKVPGTYESVILTGKGRRKEVEFNAGVIDYEGKPANLVIARDITQRKKTEKTLRNSLKEKDVLLKEVHHRVKNNMQIMSSLLRIQATKVENDETKNILRESRERIYSMALIHEKLYQSEDMASINIAQYIRDFVPHLFHSYEMDSKRAKLHMDCRDVNLDITRAIPCGLIINELISNALKHAFPGDREGDIFVELRQSRDWVVFSVKDNGVGLPEHIKVRKSRTMGFQLVTDLITQLSADMEINREEGLEFVIRIPTRFPGRL